MITDDWVDINIDDEIKTNWRRLLVKLQHKNPIKTHINLKNLKVPKPKGISIVLENHTFENRYVSPPHPYNLRKMDQRSKYKNNIDIKHE
tara:strand:- start:196 stop:465 length:270 start_codon:yes stop_codon:yes gene_type:complete